MKKVLIFIFLISSLNLFAQKNKSLLGFSILDEVTLTFRDGSVLSGLGRITINNNIIFKKDKKIKKQFMITRQ